ncbi:MAG: NAD(P)H-dependent glycerol-3-phosphate dehydrogenase [Acidimicrobiia bacterium]
MKVVVVGAGSWGTTVAALIGHKQPVTLWSRRTALAEVINATAENPDYLPQCRLPEGVAATSDLEAAVEAADVIVMGVPSHGYREVLASCATHIAPSTPILSLSKGIEQGSLMRMSEVTASVLPGHAVDRIGVLTGPNLAREVMTGQPAASVVAMADLDIARELQTLLMSRTFRVYTNQDVVGCEAAGALKNVMAIAAGMANGLGFGDNTKATLITRALAELTRLGVAIGGSVLTFAGLAGMGDLIATCMSSQSRNQRVGFGLGQGRRLDDIVAEMNMVAEGVKSTRGVLDLATRHGVEMPIAEQVGLVLYENTPAAAAVAALMGREAKAEMEGIG